MSFLFYHQILAAQVLENDPCSSPSPSKIKCLKIYKLLCSIYCQMDAAYEARKLIQGMSISGTKWTFYNPIKPPKIAKKLALFLFCSPKINWHRSRQNCIKCNLGSFDWTGSNHNLAELFGVQINVKVVGFISQKSEIISHK